MKGLIFDTETVPIHLHPFYDSFYSFEEKVALGEEYNRYLNIFKEKGQDFVPYPPFNAVVSIAWALIETDSKGEVILKKKGGTCHPDEKKLIEDFVDYINITKPDMYIHFNGKNYDVPLIIFKALFYDKKITHKKFLNLYKYTNDHHYDIKDIVTWFGAYPINLRTLSISLKHGDPKLDCSGADVAELWKKKSYSIIENYCKSDVDKTFQNFKKIYKFYG